MAAPAPFLSTSWLLFRHTMVSHDVPLNGIQWISALQRPLIVKPRQTDLADLRHPAVQISYLLRGNFLGVCPQVRAIHSTFMLKF